MFVGAALEYTVKYPTDFAYADLSTELANAVIAKDLGFGEEFNVEVFKRVLTAYLSELAPEDFDALVKAYKKEQSEMESNKAHADPQTETVVVDEDE